MISVVKALSIFLFVWGAMGCTKQAAFHQEYRARMAQARTASERRENEFEYRLLCLAEKNQIKTHFTTRDGVSEFEAWMLAKIYSGETFGSCQDIELPERRGREWVVRVYIGRPAQEGPPVIIDSASGRLTCVGHPTIERPIEYIAEFGSEFTHNFRQAAR